MTPRIACDVLVVGGGSSGCVVVGRLAAESDARVVLVEAGPDYGPRASGPWPADLLDGGALATSHDWGYASGEIAGREPITFPRAREGIERARELAATEPLYALIGPETTPSLDRAIGQYHAHYYHPVGTCAMGAESDPLAVCDGAGRVRGLEGVLVADCSLMPVVPRANTNVPAVLVGEKIAELLLG